MIKLVSDTRKIPENGSSNRLSFKNGKMGSIDSYWLRGDGVFLKHPTFFVTSNQSHSSSWQWEDSLNVRSSLNPAAASKDNLVKVNGYRGA